MTPKQIFDKNYEIYRNRDGRTPIPLEARQLIFDTMDEYLKQKTKNLNELIKLASDSIETSGHMCGCNYIDDYDRYENLLKEWNTNNNLKQK